MHPFSRRRQLRGRFAWLMVVALAALLGLGGLVMALWNAVMVPVLHVGALSYWQALGLLALCRLLVGNWGGGWARRGGAPARPDFAKWQRLSPAERQQFRQRWQSPRFGPPAQGEAEA